MANKVQWLGAAILSAALSTPAAAEPPSASETVAKIKAGAPVESLFVVGLLVGMGAVNAYIKGRGNPPLYCQPENLSVTAPQAGDILERYLKKIPGNKNTSVDIVLLYALIDVFPCKAKP